MRTRHVRTDDLPAVLDVLTAAFADDPMQRWLFEPASDAVAGIRALFDVFLAGYFAIGNTFVTDDLSGAALWAPPDRTALPDERIGELVGALAPHLGDEVIPRLTEIARVNDYRPTTPYVYLGVLGVDPAHQGRGVGSRLVAPMLAECDRMGAVAHLESSNPRNIAFYERHGFEIVADFRCGGDGALVTILTRQPR